MPTVQVVAGGEKKVFGSMKSVQFTGLTAAERVRLIKKALVDCGQEPTPAAIEKQFKYETGMTYAKAKAMEKEND